MGRRRSRVISWNGIVTYGAMAMGAPLGVLCFAWGGLQGLALTVMGVALLALPRPSVKTNKGNPLSFRAVLGRVWLYGMALALASSRRLLPYFMMLKAGMAPPLRSRYLASHLLARVCLFLKVSIS
ncbi:major facilitator superfamily transporter [Salmonella enterica subsp. arizonae]|nr:major facilitator superfamily transporter [Salmonella enterica subsp. arizonae]